jgi:hypothetical protein
MSVGRDISRRLNVGFFYWASDQYKWVWFSPFFFFFFYLFLNQDLNNINQEKMKKIKNKQTIAYIFQKSFLPPDFFFPPKETILPMS